MTMLPAPHPSPGPEPVSRAPIAVVQATLRDVPRLTVSRTAAIAARRRYPARILIRVGMLATALQLTTEIGRGEVFTTGRGSSVVMTPTPAQATAPAAIAAATGTYLLLVLGIPYAIITATIGGPAAAIGVAVTGCYLLALLVGPVLATGNHTRAARAELNHRPLPDPTEPVVRCHDLIRDPRDPAGTGIALLEATILDARFAQTTIVTIAATRRLAAAYLNAGMTVIPGSGTALYRSAAPHQRTGAR